MGTSWQRSQISHWWVDRRQVRSHPLSPGELRFLRGRTEDTLHTHDRASEPDPRFSSGLCSEPSADHSHDTRLRPTTELRPTTLWSLRMMALGLIRDDNDLAYREEVEQLVGRWRVSSMASTWLLTSGRISPVTPHFSSTTLLWSWGGGVHLTDDLTWSMNTGTAAVALSCRGREEPACPHPSSPPSTEAQESILTSCSSAWRGACSASEWKWWE